MADEIALGISMRINKGGFALERSLAPILATMAGDAVTHKVISVGTNKETLDLGDVATPGLLMLINLDAENFIAFGADADTPFGKVSPGRFALLEAAGATISVKADTAACLLEYILLEA